MSHPIYLERDCNFVDWTARIAGLATSASNGATQSWNVRSDGLKPDDFAVVETLDVSSVTAGNCECAGAHIKGPEDRPIKTMYSYFVHAWCEDPNLRPIFFVGLSPASITSNAAGDTVTQIIQMSMPDVTGTAFSSIERRGVIGFDVQSGLEDRGLCFGVAFMAGIAVAAGDTVYMRVEVQRLVGNAMPVLDSRKQG